ncbi:MAG: ABC transporter substrate-binding protein [Deltaproteobacteria bacterium]|jgi:branched-chain amino acid transport system substrate-binding protein|nr:MAG: ABC transporter substrate-binding protein [Deltaproteobacteria bacterium]
MEKRYLPALLLVGFLILILLISQSRLAYSKEAGGITKDLIKIGVIVDMTGPTADLQTPAPKAIRTYFKNVNDRGGIHGRKVAIIVEDDRYTIPLHIAAFKKLVYKDEVFMFMEIGGTGQALALVSQFNKLKIPNFLTSTSRVFVCPTLPYHFTNGATYEDEIEIIFDWLVNVLKVKEPKIGLVRPDTEHGKVGSRSANEQAKKYGLELAADVILSPGALEAGSEVLRLKKTNPTHLILHLTPSNSACFLRDAKKFGLKAFYVGTKYTCIETMLELAGKAAENFHATNSFAAWYDNTPGTKVLREITLRYHPGTEKEIRPRGYIQGWSECMIVHEGLNRTGKNLTREGLIKAWEGMKDFDMQGLSSNVTFGTDKHQASEYCKFYKADVEKGIFNPVSDWIKAKE